MNSLHRAFSDKPGIVYYRHYSGIWKAVYCSGAARGPRAGGGRRKDQGGAGVNVTVATPCGRARRADTSRALSRL